jgi:LEA14-like dessication related protein
MPGRGSGFTGWWPRRKNGGNDEKGTVAMTRIPRPPALALAAALAACAGPDLHPEVTVVDLHFQDATLFEQRAEVVLRVRNPNDGALAVDGYRFNLDINGLHFARGLSDEVFTVPRLGEATTRARLTVSTMDILRQFTQLEGRSAMEYRIEGTLFVSGGLRRSLDFDQAGRLEAPK